jgi:hypothetical protein
MAAPQNLGVRYEAISGDAVLLTVYWDPVPGTSYYYVYRDDQRFRVDTPDVITVDGTDRLAYRDTLAWNQGQSLDLFYWVSAVDINGVEGEKSDVLTNVHPFVIQTIEKARSVLADDMARFLGKQNCSSVYEQVSTFSYKIAMDLAMGDINSEPTPTGFNYANFPKNWQTLLVLGTICWIIPRINILEAAKAIQFQDQGQQWTPPQLREMFEKLLDYFRSIYDERRTRIKRNIVPGPRGIGSSKALHLAPNFIKWRHVQANRPYFAWAFALVAYELIKYLLPVLQMYLGEVFI